MNSTKKILWTIFLTIFIDMFGVGILIPIFPMLVVPGSIYRVTPDSWTTAQGFIMAGWLMAVYPLAQFICTPILGQLADKHGRRIILAISITGTAVAYVLFAIGIYTKNIPLLFFARILDGTSGGNISVAQAVIGDVSDARSRAKNFGLVGVSIGVGFVFGPFIGGRLSDPNFVYWFDAATPFWFAALISAINVILVIKLLPETLTHKGTHSINLIKSVHNIIKIFTSRNLLIIVVANFLFNSGFTFFTTFWGVILAYKFNYNQGGIGDFFAYVGIMIILAQGFVVRRLSGKIAENHVLNFSIIATGFCLLGYFLIPKHQAAWLYYLTPILAVSVALTRSFNMSLLSRMSINSTRGEIMGMNSSASALAQAIPAIISGYLALSDVTLTVLVGAIVTIIGGIFFIFTFKKILL